MRLKCAFHTHSGEDPKDQAVPYSAVELLYAAKDVGINVLAITHHTRLYDTPEIRLLARELGILFIPGIEVEIGKAHTLILNARKDAEKVHTFGELRQYRFHHPESFVIAPHPFYVMPMSLGKKLEKHIDLFDGIERSYFATKYFDLNKKAEKLAEKYKLPFVATSDCHILRMVDIAYCLVEAEYPRMECVFAALREGRYENVYRHLTHRELVKYSWETMRQ